MSTIEDDDAPLAFTILLILALTIYLSLSAPIFLGILTPISVTIYLLLSIALTFLNGFFTLIFLLYATSFDLEQHQTSITTQEIIFAIITGGILLGETILISIFFALIAPFGNLSFLVSTLIYVLYLIILGVMGLMSYFFR